MRVPTDFCIDQQKETIVSILTDHIIFERIFNGMQETVKAANPVHHYNGFPNAWIFLTGYNFSDKVEEKLRKELSAIFHKYFKEDLAKPFNERKTAKDLAQHIFIDWEYSIDGKEIERQSAH